MLNPPKKVKTIDPLENIPTFTIKGPIFEVLLHHLDDEKIKDIFISIRNKKFFDSLPQRFLDDFEFLKRCLDKQVLNIFQLPEKFQTPEYISKKEYLDSLIYFHFDFSNKQIYPQDEEIVLKLLKMAGDSVYHGIEDKFKDDFYLMHKCLCANSIFFKEIKPEFRTRIMKSNELLNEILDSSPEMISMLPKEKVTAKRILKILNKPPIEGGRDSRYYLSLVENNLKFHQEPEIALKALEIKPTVYKSLHQTYTSLFNNHKIKDNHYNFLKIYFLNQKLNQNLEIKEEPNKKLKI